MGQQPPTKERERGQGRATVEDESNGGESLESHVCREIWTRVAERKGREGKGRGYGRRGGTPVQLVVRSCSNSTYIFHGGADK